jgi:hypothetical protein
MSRRAFRTRVQPTAPSSFNRYQTARSRQLVQGTLLSLCRPIAPNPASMPRTRTFSSTRSCISHGPAFASRSTSLRLTKCPETSFMRRRLPSSSANRKRSGTSYSPRVLLTHPLQYPSELPLDAAGFPAYWKCFDSMMADEENIETLFECVAICLA